MFPQWAEHRGPVAYSEQNEQKGIERRAAEHQVERQTTEGRTVKSAALSKLDQVSLLNPG